jgi:hypothetical protein
LAISHASGLERSASAPSGGGIALVQQLRAAIDHGRAGLRPELGQRLHRVEGRFDQ